MSSAPKYVPGHPSLPFCEAVRVGDVLYLSGQIGSAPADPSHVVPGGIQAETKQALENVEAVLRKQGLGKDRVFKCLVMMADMKEWAAMNEAYLAFFGAHRPARSSFGTSGLALGARVEIECVAWAG
ncbi:MAG TPA: RidA family protein [Polyangiaceae bacterium]|jgi:reactive intermediate/imine deaminase